MSQLRAGLGQSFDATKNLAGLGLDKAKALAGRANQALVDRGVTPLGGAALAAGGIGAAMLLKHLLSDREDPDRAYYR